MSQAKVTHCFFLCFSLMLLLCSCSQKPVNVSNNSKVVFDKNKSYSKVKKLVDTNKNKDSNSIVKKAKQEEQHVEIAAGDNVYKLSRQYQVPIRDIIQTNSLTPPYNLKVGDKVTIPAASYHEVKQGDTLRSIAALYGMDPKNLAELNEIEAPYKIVIGDKVRITKLTVVATKNQTSSDTNAKTVEKKDTDKKDSKVEVAAKTDDKTNPKTSVETTIAAATTKNEVPSSIKEEETKSTEKNNEKYSSISRRFGWPIIGKILSEFGPKQGGLYNDGINISAKEGAEVKAAQDGNVAYVGNELKGYGNLVIIKHESGWLTAYAHLGKTFVKRGQAVKKSEKIGAVGATGNVTAPQLYFSLRKGRDAVNPKSYLR